MKKIIWFLLIFPLNTYASFDFDECIDMIKYNRKYLNKKRISKLTDYCVCKASFRKNESFDNCLKRQNIREKGE